MLKLSAGPENSVKCCILLSICEERSEKDKVNEAKKSLFQPQFNTKPKSL